MARELLPCGTAAAYRRHLRRGEEPCEACSLAARDERAASNARSREAQVLKLQTAVAAAPDLGEIDELSDTLENLTIVKAALVDAPPSAVAALSRRWTDLANLAVRLQSQPKPGDSIVDQLRARREERQRQASGK